MTVDELIEELKKVEDKSLPVTIDTSDGFDHIENAEINSADECIKYGMVCDNTFEHRKVILLSV